jgi:hypothetical protein
VIRIGEAPATADRHETRVANFREDHRQHPFCSRRCGLLIRSPGRRDARAICPDAPAGTAGIR